MNDVIDQTQTPVEPAGGEKTTPPAVTPVAGEGDGAESGKTAAAQQFIDNLLTKFDLDTPDALGGLIDELAGVREKVGDHDIDDLLENKNLMIQYQAQWAAAEEKNKREAETPQETIDRLSKELKTRDSRAAQDRQRREEEKENQNLITGFNSFVTKEIKTLANVGDHLKPFLGKYLGVNNPIHDHDLSDRAGIRSLVADAGKAIIELEKAILAKHGVKPGEASAATTTPPVSTTGETAGDGGAEGGPVIKNLKEARKTATALLLSKLGKGGAR